MISSILVRSPQHCRHLRYELTELKADLQYAIFESPILRRPIKLFVVLPLLAVIVIYGTIVAVEGYQSILVLKSTKNANCSFEAHNIDARLAYFNLMNDGNVNNAKMFRMRLFFKFVPNFYKEQLWIATGCKANWKGRLREHYSQ